MKRFKCRQLYVTDKAIREIGIIEIAEQLKGSKVLNEGLFVRSFSEDNSLKLDLLLNNLERKTNQQETTSILICQGSQFSSISGNFQIIIILCQAEYLSFLDRTPKVFQVRTFSQAVKLLCLTQDQIEKRWKMELILTQSRQKMLKKEKYAELAQLAVKLVQQRMQQYIILVRKFMDFYGRRKMNIQRKYFLEWAIMYHQKNLDNYNEELVKGYEFLRRSNTKLVTKCFMGWKEAKKMFREKMNYKITTL